MKKKSLFRRILNIVGVVVMLALAGFLAFIVLSNMGGNTTFIAGHTIVWVKTGSMEPAIPARSYALMEKITADDVEVGDVILFVSSDPELAGSMNTHRVVEIAPERQYFISKGDNNAKPDRYYVQPENVVARFQRSLPLLSKAGRLLSSSAGLIIVTFAIVFLMLVIFLPDIIAAIRSKDKEDKQKELDERVRAEVERLKAEAEQKQKAPPEEKDGDATEKTAKTTPTDQQKEEEA